MVFHSLFEYHYLWLPLIGFIIGLFASMTGSGGGFFFLPVLILLFKVPGQIAVPTSLAATLPICIVGSFGHFQRNNIHLRTGIIFAAAGIIGAIIGARLTNLMTSDQLKTSFGIYSMIISVQMIVSNRKDQKAKAMGVSKISSPFGKVAKGTVYGFFAGIIAGTFGTSGTAPVLAGLFALRLPIKIVIGTSLMIVTINTISALGAHFLIGKIDLTITYFLTSGAVIGAFSGPKILSGIKLNRVEGSVRNWYALGLIVFGVLMIVA